VANGFADGSLVVCDLPVPVQMTLACATPGTVVGPYSLHRGFEVCRVDRRRAPTIDDLDIRRRAYHAAVDAAVRVEMAQRIRWHVVD
jgi:hypothetical protein